MINPQESVDHSKENDYRTIEQTMENLSGGTRRLAAQLTTSASFDSLWSVLTDYDRLISTYQIFYRVKNYFKRKIMST